jgi:hypothetical protein
MRLDLEPTWTIPPLAGGEPAWILCRGLNQFPIADDAMLQRWAERRRVRPDDYLVNPRLDTCVQAKEMAALKIFFKDNVCSHLLALGIAAVRSLSGLADRTGQRHFNIGIGESRNSSIIET